MPCRSFDDDNHDSGPYWKGKLDVVTDLLCQACQALDKAQGVDGIVVPPEVITWWEEHQQKDRERLIAEQKAMTEKQRQAALAKLTPHERKLLGL